VVVVAAVSLGAVGESLQPIASAAAPALLSIARASRRPSLWSVVIIDLSWRPPAGRLGMCRLADHSAQMLGRCDGSEKYRRTLSQHP
jgi:hypothetical protein